MVLTVVLLSAILSVGIGLFNLMFWQVFFSGQTGDSFRAFLAAEDGVERTLYRDRLMMGEICADGMGDPCYTEGTTNVASGACYTLSVSKTDEDVDGDFETIITAIGQFPCNPDPLRFVKRGYQSSYEVPAGCENPTIVAVSDGTNTANGPNNAGGPAAELTFIHPGWTATTSNGVWIWETDPVSNPQVDETVRFSKTFSIQADVSSAELNIASDNTYRVWINGTFVGGDSSIDNFTIDTQDRYNVKRALVSGTNTIEIEVTNIGIAGSTPLSNPAGLLYALEICSL